jgi:hypothetical protein
MPYPSQTWTDGVSFADAERLNHMEAGIAAASVAVNVLEYGAKVDGVTDDSEAWTDAVEAVGACGTIVMPSGISLVESGVNLEGLQNINLVGQGSQAAGSALRTNRTDEGVLINAKHSRGCGMSGMELFHGGPIALNGAVIDAGGGSLTPTDYLAVHRCLIVATTSESAAIDLVRADYGISHRFTHCAFTGGRWGIRGRDEASIYLNGLELASCTFSSQAQAPLRNLGQTTDIHACVFEPAANGLPLVLLQDASVPLMGFSFHGNQIPDTTATTGVAMLLNGMGIHIDANDFFSPAAEGTKIAIQLNGTTEGITIANNIFEKYHIGIDKNGQTATGVAIGPNVYRSVGTHHNFTPAGTLYVET